MTMRLEPVRADGQTCARCGADRAEVRKYRAQCPVLASWLPKRRIWRHHIWKWSSGDDHDSD